MSSLNILIHSVFSVPEISSGIITTAGIAIIASFYFELINKSPSKTNSIIRITIIIISVFLIGTSLQYRNITICRNCNQNILYKDEYCGNCGNKNIEFKNNKCSKCNKKNNPKNKFCNYCGTKL